MAVPMRAPMLPQINCSSVEARRSCNRWVRTAQSGQSMFARGG